MIQLWARKNTRTHARAHTHARMHARTQFGGPTMLLDISSIHTTLLINITVSGPINAILTCFIALPDSSQDVSYLEN